MRPTVPAVLAVALLVSACGSLPSLAGRTESTAIPAAAGTRLHDGLRPLVDAHPGLSGIHPLTTGESAFAARAALAEAADRSLDVQYYIWHGDLSGRLLFESLRRAADRGVRVRLLLDDNGVAGLDGTLSALDAHPNVEVRLFNPFVQRSFRPLGYVTDFSRLNRRMHNKSFTADAVATVVGGRNVGDEYFAAGEGIGFLDLDVIAIGPAVGEVAAAFDAYWASESAYPADRVLEPATPESVARLVADGQAALADPATARYAAALRDSEFARQLIAGRLEFEWARTTLHVDDPAKGLGKAPPEKLLVTTLGEVIGPVQREFHLVSPYFVPKAAGTEALGALAQRGVRVSVLTNALEATDVAAVHAGYAKRRKPLLEDGVKLYELKRTAAAPEDAKSGGSSGASLHAKTFAVDRERVFVGSFNFDPRSAQLNTEMGLVIESPTLAGALANAFETVIPPASYELRLDADGDLQWVERRGAEILTHDSEPNTSGFKRFGVGFMSILPIEGLL